MYKGIAVRALSKQEIFFSYFKRNEKNTLQKVQAFLEKYPNFNLNTQNAYKQTALHLAVLYEKLDVLEFLISKGAQLEVKDIRGETPFFTASNLCVKEAMLILLKHNVNINAQNNDKETPLHLCAQKNAPAELLFLLERGANPNMQNKNGDTPLHYVARHLFSATSMTYLLKNGANPLIKNNFGKTARDNLNKVAFDYFINLETDWEKPYNASKNILERAEIAERNKQKTVREKMFIFAQIIAPIIEKLFLKRLSSQRRKKQQPSCQNDDR